MVPDVYERIILTPQVTYYHVKKGIYNKYLKYYFDTPKFQQIFNNWAGAGSTRAYLGITEQHKLPILLPPLTTQEKIVRVLSSLDDKIELNNRINQNLEQQAQAIFDKYIKIPCNYLKTGTIGDYCNVKSGFAFKSSWWKDSGVKVIKIKTIDNESINFTEC